MFNKIVKKIFHYGNYQKAKSIQIQSNESYTNISYDTGDGYKTDINIAKELQDGIIDEIKRMLDIKVENIEKKYFKINNKDFSISFKLSIADTSDGKRVIIDIINKKANVFRIKRLGLERYQLHILKKSLEKKSGLILICGPHNSGRTTTFYSILNELNDPKKNITSIERDIEQNIEGISQILIGKNYKFEYNRALDNAIKHHSEIIAIDELNSSNADDVFRASQASDLVIAIIDSPDAITAIDKLRKMGINNATIANNLKLIITPKIFDKNCTYCTKKYKLSKIGEHDIKHTFGKEALKNIPNIIYKSAGCKKCNNTKHKGKIGVFEMLNISDEIKEVIKKNGDYEEIKNVAKKNGFIPLEKNIFTKVENGIISIDEVIKKSPKGDIKL